MIVCLWLSLVCSVDSGEVLFERAMSLSPSQAEVVFAEAAESFVDDAASNPHPNVLFNAGLAFAQAGNRPKAKQMLQYAIARGATPEARRTCSWFGNRMAQTPFGHRCPGLHLSLNSGLRWPHCCPRRPWLAGALLSAAGVLWGLRRADLAGLTLVAALVVVLPLFSRFLPIPGAIAASELIPFEGPGDGYAATNATFCSPVMKSK